MKAFTPRGARWFSRTTVELMDEWLEDPELMLWLGRAREFRALKEPLWDLVAEAITDATLEALEQEELRALENDPIALALASNARLRAAVFANGEAIDEIREILRPVRGPRFDCN